MDATIDRLRTHVDDASVVARLARLALGKPVSVLDVNNRMATVASYKQQLAKLQALPVMEQRTPAWYSARNTMITASDFAQALGKGKFGTQKQFFQKKCGYEVDTFNSFQAALMWGVMYEPVAVDAYAYNNNCVMHDFGLLRHPTLDWVGASPDGISENGIMLEIKCPFKRKITGEIPTQYYYQMQGQLDVCALKECDFLECEFVEYDNIVQFKDHFADNQNPKGIVIQMSTASSKTPKYEYSPYSLHDDCPGLVDWLDKSLAVIDDDASVTATKLHMWQLYTYSVVRVYRDDTFLRDDVYTPLALVWEKVKAYKLDKSLYDMEITTPPTRVSTTTEPKVSISISTSVKNDKAVKFDKYAFVDES